MATTILVMAYKIRVQQRTSKADRGSGDCRVDAGYVDDTMSRPQGRTAGAPAEIWVPAEIEKHALKTRKSDVRPAKLDVGSGGWRTTTQPGSRRWSAWTGGHLYSGPGSAP